MEERRNDGERSWARRSPVRETLHLVVDRPAQLVDFRRRVRGMLRDHGLTKAEREALRKRLMQARLKRERQQRDDWAGGGYWPNAACGIMLPRSWGEVAALPGMSPSWSTAHNPSSQLQAPPS